MTTPLSMNIKKLTRKEQVNKMKIFKIKNSCFKTYNIVNKMILKI